MDENFAQENDSNPYQAPSKGMEPVTNQHGTFLQVFERYLWVRLAWVAGCWLIGLILIFSGFTSVWLRRLGDEVSLAVLLLGLVVFLLGPILWYVINALNRPARQRPIRQRSQIL